MELADVGSPRTAEVTWQWVALFGVVVVAALTQRITGLGFALVATPAALIFLGPQAVPFIAVMGAIVGALSLAATWRQFRPRAVVSLSVVTILTMIPIIIVVRGLSDAWASIAAGAIVLVATGIAALPSVRWAHRMLGSPILAGVLTGVSAALAGLAGPPAAAYGIVRGWGESFVPNLQVVLILTLPALVIGRGWPTHVPLWLTVATLIAVAVGTALGTLVRHRISQTIALSSTRVLALTGGIVALVHGMSGL